MSDKSKMQHTLPRLWRWLASGVLALGIAVSGGAWGQITASGVTGTGGSVSIAFADQQVNTTQVRTITLTYNSTVTFANPSVDTSSLSGTPFEVKTSGAVIDDGCAGQGGGMGGVCTISVRFTPTAEATYATYFRVATTAPAGYPGVFVNLTGKGITGGASTNGSTLTISPTTLDFGNVRPGSKAIQSVTITAGGGNVTFAGIAVPNGYTATHSCGTQIPAGGSCSATITFAPTAKIPYDGSAVLTTGQTAPQFITLKGSGGDATVGGGSTPALLVIEPAVLDFDDVPVNASKTGELRLANRGGSQLTAQIARSDNQFLPLVGSCYYAGSVNLAAGASCKLSVQFKPTQIGNITGKLSFSGSGAEGMAVDVRGRGTGGSSSALTGMLVASPTNIAFGSLELGSSVVREVRLSLSGASQRPSLIGVEVPEGFRYEHDCVTATSSTCTLRLVFAPTEVKDYQGVVIVNATNDSAAFITVSGTGSRAVRMSAATRGELATQNIIGQFRFAAGQAGQAGNLYVALLHDDKLYFQSYGQWLAYQPGVEPQPYLRGNLTDTDLTIVSAQDAARYPGAVLFLGYGRNLEELINYHQYAPVMVIE